MSTVTRPVLSQHDVEQRMIEIDDALAETTLAYADLADAAADAEAVYKEQLARALLAVAASADKATAAVRQARAELACVDAFRTYKLADARRGACREALLSYRARLDSLRTLNANIRAVTTH